MKQLRALIACERSGVVREAFRAQGWYAYSADLQPADDASPYHVQGDVRALLTDGWDLLIAHPPCTYLSASGLHWNTRRPERAQQTLDALDFVRALMDAPIPYRAIENPVGRIGTAIGAATQTIQPYEFGDDASKRTCLWLFGLPALIPTAYVEPRIIAGKPRWSNQTDSGQNRLTPSPDRAQRRAQTYPGIARAMAEQWTAFLTQSPR